MGKALELLQKQLAKYVELQQRIDAKAAERDRDRAILEADFETATLTTRTKLEELKAQLEAWAQDNRDELFGKKKSITVGDVKIGFRFGQPVIEWKNGNELRDDDQLIERIHDKSETAGRTEKKLLEDCLIVKTTLSKTKVKDLPETLHDTLGIKVMQTEKFFVSLPKSE